jgi:UDP-N-acetylglucosamine--N-acetylmuramyl-(pentapeptide) pyrophosphoryl-undecaprenol N-acetylglucosamine transferase
VVFSLGGYVAGAVSLAARASRVPLALMEPNSVPGLANRWIAPFVQRAYVAFDETVRHFPRKSVLRSGVAIRSGFEPRPYAPNPGLLRVLVLGGSQGARALNLAIPRAAGACTNALQIVHQVGRGNTEPVIAAYAQHAPQRQARVVEFIEEMPQALADADPVISRSGASAVSEICAVGRPSILVPYPFAAGDHQKGNALALAGIDAALCVEEVAQDAQGEATAEKIAQALNELTGDAHRLEAMARAARAWGRPQAARQVALDLLQLGGLSVQEPAGGTAPDGKIDGLLRVGVAAPTPAVSQGRA